MTSGLAAPAREEFALDRPMVPVVRRLLADSETAVGIYRKLARNRPGTVLLESADRGLVFDAGRLVQDGSHAELVAEGGVYGRLHASWVAQSNLPGRMEP